MRLRKYIYLLVCSFYSRIFLYNCYNSIQCFVSWISMRSYRKLKIHRMRTICQNVQNIRNIALCVIFDK